ncbi:hypothetical protein B0T14DRAFT_576114 [Immersiella caudata]|uniref:Uncharacterized protein n=1 Tax=Immersiella caudata TaxID=314043 RepID=A0AA40CCL1_9PEZI|nr:hypothetical protein B0T14DRAFT_576114 [Immersiella caudata]
MPKKSPDSKKLEDIARKAEHDLNTYQSKTDTGRDHPSNIKDSASGSSVMYGEGVVTSAGMDQRVPPDEGGEIDDRKHFIHGSAYLGKGGPEDKTAKIYQESPGGADEISVKMSGRDRRALRKARANPERPDLLPPEEMPNFVAGDPPRRDEIMERGRSARKINLGRSEYDKDPLPSHQHTSRAMYKGQNGAPAKTTEDENAMMGIIPPDSVVLPGKRSMMQ